MGWLLSYISKWVKNVHPFALLNNIIKSITWRSLILFVITGFLCLVLAVECLKRASTKDFWGDETTDIYTTLPSPYGEMVRGHIFNQQTASPLYFIVQKAVFGYFLREERARGRGYDWRISARIVPAVSVVLGTLVAALILINVSPLTALSLPVLLTNHSMVTWYGAETRMYGTWIGASLLFYALSFFVLLKMLSIKDEHSQSCGRRVGGLALWFLSIFILLGITVSGLVQVAAQGVMLFVTAFVVENTMSHTRSSAWRKVLVPLVGMVFAAALFKLWNVRTMPLRLENAPESLAFYIEHFKHYALMSFGGLKGVLILCAAMCGLVAVAFRYKTLSYKKRVFYMFAAFLGLGQLLVVLPMYAGQILSGYFFAERHSIFGAAARSLTMAASADAVAVVCASGIWALMGKAKRKPSGVGLHGVQVVVAAIVFVAVCFDWVRWSLIPMPSSVQNLWAQKKLYCHGPVVFNKWNIEDYDTRIAEQFNTINKARHSGQCAYQVGPNTIDFSPEWIYGGIYGSSSK